jgi:hypothetical protein
VCARERQMTVLVYVIGASWPLGGSRATGSFGALEHGQFLVDRRADVSEAGDDRFRDVPGVIGQMRGATTATECTIGMTVTLVVLVDDLADMRDQIRHCPSRLRRTPLSVVPGGRCGFVLGYSGRPLVMSQRPSTPRPGGPMMRQPESSTWES